MLSCSAALVCVIQETHPTSVMAPWASHVLSASVPRQEIGEDNDLPHRDVMRADTIKDHRELTAN